MTDQPTGWGALFSGRNGTRALVLAGGVVLQAINVYVATTILPSVARSWDPPWRRGCCRRAARRRPTALPPVCSVSVP